MTEDEMVGWRHITDSKAMSLSKLWELVTDREAGSPQSTGLQRIGHNGVTEQRQDWLYSWVRSPACWAVLC